MTRALGAETGIPTAPVLAGWIADHRGRTADITTFRLLFPLQDQVTAGITTTCSGGLFYQDRVLAALEGIRDKKAVGELHVTTRDVIEDAAGIVLAVKRSWCALPSPCMLGITDTYFHDPFEWNDAICGAYRTILRAMRDTGVEGHVLLCDTADKEELAALSWQKVFFFLREPDRPSLALLLEHQPQVAIRKVHLPLLFSLADEYDIARLFLLDPDPAAIASALQHLDPDQLVVAGYDTGGEEEYWKKLAASAEYSV